MIQFKFSMDLLYKRTLYFGNFFLLFWSHKILNLFCIKTRIKKGTVLLTKSFFIVLYFAKEKGGKCKLERPLISRLFLLSAVRLHCWWWLCCLWCTWLYNVLILWFLVLQWCVVEFLLFLHKPYWNRVTLSHDYIR